MHIINCLSMYHTFLLSLSFLSASIFSHAQEKKDSVIPAKLTNDGVLTYTSAGISKSYKSVLVISVGSIETRLFTKNLYIPLAGSFSQREMGSILEPMGNQRQNIDQKIRAAVQQHHVDAVLAVYDRPGADTVKLVVPVIDPRLRNLLSQMSGLAGPYTSRQSTAPRPAPRKRGSPRGTFMVILADPADNKVIWKGEIFVFSNFKSSTYEKISKALMDEWVNNKIFEGIQPVNGQN